MLSYDAEIQTIVGPAGSLPVLGDDEISQKLLMLIEGQCGLLGPKQAAAKFGFTKQRYGVGHMTQDTCGKPYLPTLHLAFKAHIMSAEVPKSSKESWCPSMAIRLA